MKPSTSLAVYLAAFTPLAAAWPQWLPHVDSLIARQDDDASDASATPTPAPSASESGTSDEASASASGSASGRPTRSATDLNTASLSSGSASGGPSKTTSASVKPDDPVGGVVMMTPAPTDPGMKLYKINDNVTFGWNYTDLQITPTAIDVLLSCKVASATWTLTQNMTFETDVSFLWDSSEQAAAVQSPLLTEEYTLLIYDAESDISATPEPGKLGVYDQFTFNMYQPKDPVALKDYKCPTCSAAPPNVDPRAYSFAISMSLITVASFTWFVTGLGI